MSSLRLTCILILCAFMTACASKAVEKEQGRQQRAQMAQEQMDLAMQELDSGEAPSQIPESALAGKTENERKALEAANEAQKELNCEIAGGKNCSTSVAEKPRSVIPVQEEPVTVAERPRPGSEIRAAAIPSSGTKFPMKDGYPVWFHFPGYDGYLGGVGIAKPQKNGYSAQRRVAASLAQADLARSVKVNVDNELVSERLLVDSTAREHYQEKISTMSRQDANEYIQNPVVMDEWMNGKTGELYIWVVLPK